MMNDTLKPSIILAIFTVIISGCSTYRPAERLDGIVALSPRDGEVEVRLKLDRTFVESMDTQASDLAIVQAVITMGHALGMRVTAEGVERAEQAARLRALGCDCAMGWLWSPALVPEELLDAIADGFPVADVTPLRGRRAS